MHACMHVASGLHGCATCAEHGQKFSTSPDNVMDVTSEQQAMEADGGGVNPHE